MSFPSRTDSAFLDVDGPVHVTDLGGDPEAPTILCVHGLASSHVGWRRFARGLTTTHRVLALDLPGHGRSPRSGRSAGVSANQVVLDRVLESLGRPVTLVGHSMGASVSILQAAHRPDTVSALALLAPPMPRRRGEHISPALAARVALCTWPWLARTLLGVQHRRLGSEELVRRRLELTCASADSIDDTTRQLLVELLEGDVDGDGHAAFVEAARSVGFLVARAADYSRAIAAVRAPTMVLHGAEDRILSHAGVTQLATLQPLWHTAVMDGLGHSPHMEAPVRTAQVVAEFLDQLARAVPTASRELRQGTPTVVGTGVNQR